MLCRLWLPGAPKNGSAYGTLYTCIYSSGKIRKFVYFRYLFHGTNHVAALVNYNGTSKIRFWSYAMDVVRNDLIMCCQVYKQILNMPGHPVTVQYSYLNWNTVCVRRQLCKLGDSTRIYMSNYKRVQRLNERQCSNLIFNLLCLHKYKKNDEYLTQNIPFKVVYSSMNHVEYN